MRYLQACGIRWVKIANLVEGHLSVCLVRTKSETEYFIPIYSTRPMAMLFSPFHFQCEILLVVTITLSNLLHFALLSLQS